MTQVQGPRFHFLAVSAQLIAERGQGVADPVRRVVGQARRRERGLEDLPDGTGSRPAFPRQAGRTKQPVRTQLLPGGREEHVVGAETVFLFEIDDPVLDDLPDVVSHGKDCSSEG